MPLDQHHDLSSSTSLISVHPSFQTWQVADCFKGHTTESPAQEHLLGIVCDVLFLLRSERMGVHVGLKEMSVQVGLKELSVP